VNTHDHLVLRLRKNGLHCPIHLPGVYRDILIAVINSGKMLAAAARVNVGSVLWFETQGQP
jgi:hypothetical protein